MVQAKPGRTGSNSESIVMATAYGLTFHLIYANRHIFLFDWSSDKWIGDKMAHFEPLKIFKILANHQKFTKGNRDYLAFFILLEKVKGRSVSEKFSFFSIGICFA